METSCDVNARELMESVVSFIRSFGLHKPDQTPCGQPVATAEAHALTDLASFGPMRQRELASRLRLEKSTVSRLMRKMKTNRWIQRTCDRQDGRAILIRLTRQGREAATQVARAREEKFARILSAIPPEKRSMVVEAILILEGACSQPGGVRERLPLPASPRPAEGELI
jgi:DNA-binding MarR family transcriptional regulator